MNWIISITVWRQAGGEEDQRLGLTYCLNRKSSIFEVSLVTTLSLCEVPLKERKDFKDNIYFSRDVTRPLWSARSAAIDKCDDSNLYFLSSSSRYWDIIFTIIGIIIDTFQMQRDTQFMPASHAIQSVSPWHPSWSCHWCRLHSFRSFGIFPATFSRVICDALLSTSLGRIGWKSDFILHFHLGKSHAHSHVVFVLKVWRFGWIVYCDNCEMRRWTSLSSFDLKICTFQGKLKHWRRAMATCSHLISSLLSFLMGVLNSILPSDWRIPFELDRIGHSSLRHGRHRPYFRVILQIIFNG